VDPLFDQPAQLLITRQRLPELTPRSPWHARSSRPALARALIAVTLIGRAFARIVGPTPNIVEPPSPSRTDGVVTVPTLGARCRLPRTSP